MEFFFEVDDCVVLFTIDVRPESSQGQIQENRKGGGSRCTQSVPSRTFPPPPGNFLHFLFSEVAFSAFSGKSSAQNLINF